jgi:hypothetical protein
LFIGVSCQKIGPEGSPAYATATPEVFLIEIGFAQVPDPALRARLQAIPTTLRVSEEYEALLRDFVCDVLQRSPEYRGLLESLADDALARGE